ncbi:MAG: methylenetetrahydrofolate--tRNA-(uracil(54)-C(5))-methyltransferase (FADH(2)-oxidizing) TrmFO [Faecalibacterium sp.]|jgi:methylenetetrahydrofolate--tRNA-(uracil-5-)-methyltransferase|nr:methylenetetrahydrofolate--tRNA-(uracil(54)-C(5))-methyltransferase (FADH(2)-oxidizing) TrmFO [Faecalibacterium sp.]
MSELHVTVLGAGLAGCEAALWLAGHGVKVTLYEQKPVRFSPAHKSANFAELICSNSLKAERLDSASGLLKAEMRQMGSSLLPAAEVARVAAGGALAVDRDVFSAEVTRRVEAEPNITVRREEVCTIDEASPILVATGPLTEGALAEKIAALTGSAEMHFYDAVAPIVTAESLDYEKVFAASRYGRGDDDYLNCPFNKAEYEAFYQALATAERAPLHDFDKGAENPSVAESASAPAKPAKDGGLTVYEGCMPIEVMAGRGADTMRYGPLRPVGLTDPRTGHRPWANIQLRAENKERTLYNIVGFQTNLKWGEQKRVFSMIPGLEHAEFVRYGVMHRNTFLDSPKVLTQALCLAAHPNVFFAGQITGFEGYMESAACGLLAARNIYARLMGVTLPPPPADTMCGALVRYITAENKNFQPMGANMGILPSLENRPRDKRERYQAVAERAVSSFSAWVAAQAEP